MIPTPHINASAGAFAATCLMPGDPLRAHYIAEKFLSKVQEVTNVRGMLGFTGEYQGQRLSVMGHGMGIPSASIYAHELFTEYAVERIIRVGSCGAISPKIAVHDIVLAMGACTDSGVNRARLGGCDYAAIADFDLLRHAADVAQQQQLAVHVGNVFSVDLFYNPNAHMFDLMEKYGVLGVEMEAAGIYGVAAECGKKALTLCTVSDHIRTGESLSAKARETGFDQMIELALATAIRANVSV